MARLGKQRQLPSTEASVSRAPAQEPGPSAVEVLAKPEAPAASLLGLQRSAGNRAVVGLLDTKTPAPAGAPLGSLRVQRVKDAFGVSLKKDSLKLADNFTGKHVAADKAKAEEVTDARYRDGKMPTAMQNGEIPNTVATLESWVSAVETSESTVDTENDKWTKDIPIKVGTAWQVRWDPDEEVYDTKDASSLALKAGGYAKATYAGTKGRRAQEVTGGSFNLDHISNA